MSISKKTVKDINMTGKKIIMRVDFNVPMKDGVVQDDTRIRAALPTIKYVLDQNVTGLILMSHLGDPKKDLQKAKDKAAAEGKAFDEAKYMAGKHKLAPVAEYLSKLLEKPVQFASSCLGEEAKAKAEALKSGEVLMLENTRFFEEETSKDASAREKMAKELASYADIYVNDAFGTAHRAHASTETIAQYLPAVAGFLMEKELVYLEEKVVNNAAKPFVAIIGGAKVSSKLAVLESLLNKADALIIGGSMAYTFLKAKGISTGASLVEDDMLDTAKAIIAKAASKGAEIYLPVDHLVAKEMSQEAVTELTSDENITGDWKGYDIGPKSIELFNKALSKAKTVFWNGPVGVFEIPNFAKGTFALAQTIAGLTDTCTVIGGGDSVSAVNKAGLADKMSHVSTGGGASLELIEGKILPGVAALQNK
jgi:3-phosphoglycerate kinase